MKSSSINHTFFSSYSLEDERGIFPETQFIFDLEIPSSFKPVNTDGEVQSFHLLSIEEVCEIFTFTDSTSKSHWVTQGISVSRQELSQG